MGPLTFRKVEIRLPVAFGPSQPDYRGRIGR
jgi:hypothetical protein